MSSYQSYLDDSKSYVNAISNLNKEITLREKMVEKLKGQILKRCPHGPGDCIKIPKLCYNTRVASVCYIKEIVNIDKYNDELFYIALVNLADTNGKPTSATAFVNLPVSQTNKE